MSRCCIYLSVRCSHPKESRSCSHLTGAKHVADAQALLSLGQSCKYKYYNMSRWLIHAALWKASVSQGHPFLRKNMTHVTCPWPAAAATYSSFQWRPLLHHHCSTASWPAAAAHRLPSNHWWTTGHAASLILQLQSALVLQHDPSTLVSSGASLCRANLHTSSVRSLLLQCCSMMAETAVAFKRFLGYCLVLQHRQGLATSVCITAAAIRCAKYANQNLCSCTVCRIATMEGVLALVRLYQHFTFSLNKAEACWQAAARNVVSHCPGQAT